MTTRTELTITASIENGVIEVTGRKSEGAVSPGNLGLLIGHLLGRAAMLRDRMMESLAATQDIRAMAAFSRGVLIGMQAEDTADGTIVLCEAEPPIMQMTESGEI